MEHNTDKDYLENIYYKTCYAVRRYLRNKCDSWSDAEDVMQDTYYEVWTHLDAVRASENEIGYVINVTKNKYLQYRADKRRKLAENGGNPLPWEPVFVDTSAEDMELWDFVKRTLKYKDYLIVRLRYENRDSFRAIAEKLNMTEAACKMRLKRSLEKLKKARENQIRKS